jgi:hypothetical protein
VLKVVGRRNGFSLLRELFEEAGIVAYIGGLLSHCRVLLAQLVLRDFKHLLQVFQALLQRLSAAWDAICSAT